MCNCDRCRAGLPHRGEPALMTYESPLRREQRPSIVRVLKPVGTAVDDEELVQRALQLAVVAHDHQRRPVGSGGAVDEPYVMHAIRVASKFTDPAQRIVALLHDVIEDTPVTYEEIHDSFGIEIAEAVFALTRQKDSETYAEFIRRIAASGFDLTIGVKTEDLRDNLTDMPPGKESLRDRYELALELLPTIGR